MIQDKHYILKTIHRIQQETSVYNPYAIIYRLYHELFNKIPNTYYYQYTKDKNLHCFVNNGVDVLRPFEFIEDKERVAAIDVRQFLLALYKEHPFICVFMKDDKCVTHGIYVGEDYITIVDTEDLAIDEISKETALKNLLIFSTQEPEFFIPYIPEYKERPKSKTPIYRYVSVSNGDFDYSNFKILKNPDVSLDNYNDDLPYQELLDFCNAEYCGLSLLYGTPGTGKTTLIKKLITNSDATFYLLDASLLANITSAEFLDFLTGYCSSSVFILEDCEKLLVDRNKNYNPWIGTLLNLTDGMLGEGLGIRFICTFNASIKDIDPALLRKGRLKICYEFKPLAKEKVDTLAKELHKDISGMKTLAEIYTDEYVCNSSLNKTVKIGF